MQTPEVLEVLRLAGLTASLTARGGLAVAPAGRLTLDLRELVRMHRDALIVALRPDPDRWCWPRSNAMTGAEIATFTRRVEQLTSEGLSLADAEVRADTMVRTDREALHPP
jgi:hypothetical protein